MSLPRLTVQFLYHGSSTGKMADLRVPCNNKETVLTPDYDSCLRVYPMIEKTTEPKPFSYKKALSYLIQVVIVGLLVLYFYQNRDVFESLKNIRWQQIVWIVLLDIAAYLINSILNYSMIRQLDPRVTFLDCFMLQYVNNLLNKILPTIGGGAAFRAIYLKKKYQFPYSQFASTVAGLYVISFSATSLIGIFCLLVIYAWFQVFNWIIFLAFAGILLPTLFIIMASPQIPKSDRRVLRVLKSVVEGWNVIKKKPRFVFAYGFLAILLLLISTLQTYISYEGLGIKTNLIPMLYLSTLGIIMAFLNFTPDGIGVKEGIFIFSKDLVRIPEDILVLGSLYLRGISIFSTFVIGGISYWLLMREMKRIDDSLPAVLD